MYIPVLCLEIVYVLSPSLPTCKQVYYYTCKQDLDRNLFMEGYLHGTKPISLGCGMTNRKGTEGIL